MVLQASFLMCWSHMYVCLSFVCIYLAYSLLYFIDVLVEGQFIVKNCTIA